MARPYSLRRRLLVWLMIALLAVAALAVIDTWREARDTANSLSDRVLAGSVLAIAERVIVTEDGAAVSLGDNRAVSIDSRDFGSVPVSSIRATVPLPWVR